MKAQNRPKATGFHLILYPPFQLFQEALPSFPQAGRKNTVVPRSCSPSLKLILPEGTIGIVHVESSTNLVSWQDEWVNTCSNTNQNRFFRIRADRIVQ